MRSYQEVADALAAQIRDGQLAPGQRLPTHRQLAARWGIAVATATRAMAELKRIGLVVGEPGRGTFVRDQTVRLVPAESGPGADTVWADLSLTQPLSPPRARLLRSALRQLAAAGDLDALLRQQPPGGRPQDRAVTAAFLATHRIDADPDRVFLTGGTQHGIDLVARAMLAPGDAVAVDTLTYPGFKMIAQTHRLNLLPVPAAGEGPDVARLAQLCRRRRIRAVYTMPTLHNPLGWVLDHSSRERLVAVARDHDLVLIEDAAYAFLAEPAPPPLVTLAPERTFWVSSLSKSVAAGLRFGILVTPAPARPSIAHALRANMASLPGLVTALAVRWLGDGTVTALEAASRHAAEEQQRTLRRELGDLPVTAHPRSYFAWLPIDPEQRMDRVAAELSHRGIRVSTADRFATTTHAPHAIRIALGTPTPAELPAALTALREALNTVPI